MRKAKFCSGLPVPGMVCHRHLARRRRERPRRKPGSTRSRRETKIWTSRETPLRTRSSNSEQQLNRQLVKALVAQPFAEDRTLLEGMAEQVRGCFLGELAHPRAIAVVGGSLFENGLNLLVAVPAVGFFLEDQIRPHATAGKVLDSLIVLGPVGMSVEVARTVISDIFEKLDQKEGGLRISSAEAKVLVISPGRLVVQIDVE